MLANGFWLPAFKGELAAFDKAVSDLDGMNRKIGQQPTVEVMPLARFVLEGEIEFKVDNKKQGLELFKQACEAEERIVYAEPSPWMMTARHAYGALLIASDRFEETEKVYLRDPEVYPANGWALLGLRDALRGRGRAEEAPVKDHAFRQA